MKEPLFVAFSTQKGGAGKTTLTVLMASYLYYVRGYNVAIIDCDFPQYSIKDMRERDLHKVEQSEHLTALAYEQIKKTGKRAYTIIASRPEEVVDKANALIAANPELDIVLFDLSGTVNNKSIIETLATMDYIFCPVSADRVVMDSSLQFASMVNDHFISTGKSNIKGMYMLWNMVDKREKTELYALFEKMVEDIGVSILKTYLPDSKRFRREAAEEGEKALFRSTLFPPDRVLVRGSNLEELSNEIITLMKL